MEAGAITLSACGAREGEDHMVPDVMQRPTEPDVFTLEPGPRWPSLEQLRKGGATELKNKVGPNQVGRLRVREVEFVIVRAETWNKTYGIARDVSRLRGALILVRQAIQLAFRIRDKDDQDGVRIALDHLSELTYRLPELKTETPIPRDLTFDDTHDEDVDTGDVELDPTRVKRLRFN